MPKISAKAGAFQQEIEWAAEGGWKLWVQRSHPFSRVFPGGVCISHPLFAKPVRDGSAAK